MPNRGLSCPGEPQSENQRKLKQSWNEKVPVILIIISALGTVPKVLIRELEEMEIRGLAEITQTTVL